jgi:hypothetical protein
MEPITFTSKVTLYPYQSIEGDELILMRYVPGIHQSDIFRSYEKASSPISFRACEGWAIGEEKIQTFHKMPLQDLIALQKFLIEKKEEYNRAKMDLDRKFSIHQIDHGLHGCREQLKHQGIIDE